MTRDRRPEVVTSLERRWGGLGTGAVRATGSYEGSLTVEGTSDRHEPLSVTGWWSRRSRRLPHDGASDDAKASKRRITKVIRYSAEEGEATGVSEGRSKISKHSGKTTPTLAADDHRKVTERSEAGPKLSAARLVFGAIHRSGRGRRESPLPPVLPRRAKDSVGCPHGESRDSGPGTHEVRVHAVRLGGRSRLDASRVLSAGRSQGLVASQGASLKEARSTA